jgi:hypothetical protein
MGKPFWGRENRLGKHGKNLLGKHEKNLLGKHGKNILGKQGKKNLLGKLGKTWDMFGRHGEKVENQWENMEPKQFESFSTEKAIENKNNK